MNTSDNRTKIIAGAALAAVAITAVATWQISKSNARSSAAALVTASADMVRCAAGDKVEFSPEGVQHGYLRKLVTSLPDSSPVSDCPQPLETTKKALEDYEKVWFGSLGAAGKDGTPLGEKVRATMTAMASLKMDYPSNKLLRKKDAEHPLREFGKLTWDLYETSAAMMEHDGASADDITKAREERKREARKVAALGSKPKELFSVGGKVDPARWSLVPTGDNQLMLFAHADTGEVLVARTADAASTWAKSSGSDGMASKKNASAQMLLGPDREAWIVSSWEEGGTVHLSAGKLAKGAASLPALVELPAVPSGWKRAPGAERELAVLEGDVLAYAVMKVGEKSAKQKQEEEKNRKDWEKRSAEKEVQILLVLDKERQDARRALGIDADHVRVDGVAYVAQGKADDRVKELSGWGLGGLVAGPNPMMLMGKGELPALELGLASIPSPGQELGAVATATAPRVAKPWLRSPAWLRCMTVEGHHYAMNEGGSMLFGMRPGALEVTAMTAEASTESHMGCADGATLLSLPMQTDSIFPRVLTVRGGEVEGGKISATSGTAPDQYTSTVSIGMTGGAVIAAWVAHGFVQTAMTKSGGGDFGAPVQVGEATADGTKLTGVRLVAVGARLMMVMAREKCSAGSSCSTVFESLATEDGGKSWKSN